MNKNDQNQDQSSLIKIGAVALCVGAIVFFSAKKSFSTDNESDSATMLIVGYVVFMLLSLIIYVILARWTFKVNEIVSNQEKTNQLLESINKALLKPENNLPDGDVNNPDYLNKVINKINR